MAAIVPSYVKLEGLTLRGPGGRQVALRLTPAMRSDDTNLTLHTVRAGVFDDVDIAICWHPSSFTGVNKPTSLACTEVEFQFTGRAAHAAAARLIKRSKGVTLGGVSLKELIDEGRP